MDYKPTKWFYLQPFLFTKEGIHLRDISRKLGQNHSTVRIYLQEFVKRGFLKITKKGNLTFYEINYMFPLVIDYLSIAEKEFLILKSSKNRVLQEIIHDLHLFSGTLILFGSSVEDFSKANDIDILCDNKIDFSTIEKKYNKEVHAISVDSLEDINPALKKEIIKKHLIINNTEGVVKWLI